MSWLIVFMSYLSPLVLLAILLSLNHWNAKHARTDAARVGRKRQGLRVG